MRFAATFIVTTFCLYGLNHCSPLLQAAEPSQARLFVATNPSQVDDDFRYQGEYMGILSSQGKWSYPQKFGLQVIAGGSGKFEAVLFRGGLPGDGWDKQNRLRSNGQYEAGTITFQIEDYQIIITGQRAIFSDARGRKMGFLQKYARQSPTMGKTAPSNSIILFDGKKNGLWKQMQVSENRLLEEGCETLGKFKDFHLHLEFRLPYKPFVKGQDRGNSGIYLQRRYEIQVLDTFGTDGLNNHCGGIYKLVAPNQNMCLPPLTWQTYDIDFRMARFDEQGKKSENMRIRVHHNGVVIHDDIEVKSKTGAGKPETPEAMPLLLQDHGNPVRYRNIWLVKGDPFARPQKSSFYHDGNCEENRSYQFQPESTICPDCSSYGNSFNSFHYGNTPAPIFNPQVPQRMW